LGQNACESKVLQVLQIVGMKFNKEAYQWLGLGISRAKSLKKLLINQTNIASVGLYDIAKAFSTCYSVEYLDL
jgi:hypothetical protein